MSNSLGTRTCNARCLMDFIDGEADLEFFSWGPDTIDFIRPSGTDAMD